MGAILRPRILNRRILDNGEGLQWQYNCGTKGEADFGIAPHFLGFLDPKSHVIWASRRGCDFIEAIYKREGADFDIAPI